MLGIKSPYWPYFYIELHIFYNVLAHLKHFVSIYVDMHISNSPQTREGCTAITATLST